ncbi:MAG: hypothetical protein JKY53_06525 [Flavobacteriales bacterium]|nr:hypothetical protein [Flavobacteriales bacterium]
MSDSFTVKSTNRLSYITTSVGISYPFEVNRINQPPKPYTTAALWDTGSSHCFITKSLATSLELHPIDKALVEHAMGRTFENVYFAVLQITEKYYIEIELTECQSINNNFEIIVGMDVINQGDFAITNQAGKTTFSFRLPSETTIDFQEDK